MSDHINLQQLKDWSDGKLAEQEAADVESHLEDCEECASKLDNLGSDSNAFQNRVKDILKQDDGSAGSDANNPVRSFAFSEKPGMLIGRYKLLQRIGQGGMGTVWMAEQSQPVQRIVALKIIKAGMDTHEVVARFENERQALALMDHPNIARVLDGGATENGRPFFVMEMVKGEPITQYCDKQQVGTDLRLKLFCDICHAVQHAHRKGIIHRDIKPSNVLITLEDSEPQVKVIDFGLAKATGGRLTEKTLYTAIGQMIGTPAYMSPEQAEQSGLAVDTRSDVYSLGVLLYELLTGMTPIDLAQFQEAGIAEIQRILREDDPPAPSTRLSSYKGDSSEFAKHRSTQPQALIQMLRGDLDVIVMKALEKDPARRYETPNHFAEDVEKYLQNLPISARPPSTAYRLNRLYQRNKVLVTSAGLIVATVLIGFVVSTVMAIRATRAEAETANALVDVRDERDRAIAAEKLAADRLQELQKEQDKTKDALTASEIARAEAEELSRLMIGVFRSPDPKLDGNAITVADLLDRAVERINVGFEDQPALRTKLTAALADTYTSLGLFDRAVPLREQAEQYMLSSKGPGDQATLDAQMSLANAYEKVGRSDEARPILQRLLKIYMERDGPDSRSVSVTKTNLANATPGKNERLKIRQEVYEQARKTRPPDDPHLLLAKDNLAISLDEAGRFEEAIKMREEVVAVRSKSLGPEDPSTLFSMRGLLLYYQRQRQFEKALPLAQENLRISRKILGPNHRYTFSSQGRVAASLEGTGQVEQGLQIREQMLERRRNVFGPKSKEVRAAMDYLIKRYALHEKWQKTYELSLERVQLHVELFGPTDRQTADAKNNAGFYLCIRPGPGEAITQQALEWIKQAESNFPENAVYKNSRGLAEYRLGNWEAAKSSLDASIKLSKTGGDPSDRYFLAMVAWQLGQKDVAAAKLVEAEKWIQQNPQRNDIWLAPIQTEARALIAGTN